MSRPRAAHTEAGVQALIDGIFRRWPALLGFSIPEAGDLVLGELETQPWLRGRTFARVLH